MNIPLSPEAALRLEQQRIEYLASMPRKIECLGLPLEAWRRNPENAAALAAIMAMVHQLCGSAALHQYPTLQQAAEHCRDQIEGMDTPNGDAAGASVEALMAEMHSLINPEPTA